MPSRIMVPLDGSNFSEQAIEYAMGIAARAGATVHLVRVHTESMPMALAPFPVLFDAELDGQAHAFETAYLERIAAPWTAVGRKVVTTNPVGPIVSTLARYADATNIDLIVMTTHGRGGLSRAWLGSVADRLVRETRVPVVLLRPRVESMHAHAFTFAPTHILIPLDGSDLSESVIEPALRLGALTHARFTLMQVLLPPFSISTEVAQHAKADDDALRRASHDYLRQWAIRLRQRGFEVETRVVLQANPAAGIIEEALFAECDLITMATHGRSGWARTALGSVTDKVLRCAPTPLLTLRPSTAADSGAASVA